MTNDQLHQHHAHPITTDLALVLGGGGAAGNAWEIGVVAGLADAGVDLTLAELVVGTSAGATAAAQLRSGRSPADLLAAILDAPPILRRGPVDHGTGGTPSLPQEVVVARMQEINAAATSAEDLQRRMGAFGLESDAVLAAAEAPRRATVAARLPITEWPVRPMLVTVIDARTGEFLALDRDSGVPLVDAVTASTALPGLVPTHGAGGRRLIDGGVRASENADLAAGHANVVVLAPLGGSRPAPEPGRFAGLRREAAWGNDLDGHVAALRAGGSRVEVLVPDAESLAAMGRNQMDPVTRAPAARAGFAQGRRAADRLGA